MPRFYRAFFRCITDQSANLTLDLLLDDNRRLVDRVPTSGWWGHINGSDVWPCILKPGGTLDFGESSNSQERYGEIDLDTRLIVQGEQYELTYQRSYSVILEKLTDIAEL